MQCDKAEELCKKMLEIHCAHSEPMSLEKVTDRKLMKVGTTAEEIFGGLTEDSATIFESVDEPEEAQKLLQKATKLLEDKPRQQSTITGIEARMGTVFSNLHSEIFHECSELELTIYAPLIASALGEGKQVHADAEKFGLYSDVYVGNNLINFYGSCKKILDAQKLFDKMP